MTPLLPVAPASIRSEASRARVMVIDDRTDVRELLSEYLRFKGYTVVALGDAADALRQLDEFLPQVVLLDILMPGLSGLSALDKIRTGHPQVGIIMVSALDDEDVAEQTFRAGAYDYVRKPVEFDYLRSSIETFLVTSMFDRETPREIGNRPALG